MPRLVFTIEPEGDPRIQVEAASAADRARLGDWLTHSSALPKTAASA